MIIPLPQLPFILVLLCDSDKLTAVGKRTVWMAPVRRKQLQFSFPILELYQTREILYKNRIVLIAAGNGQPKVAQVNISKFVYLSTKCVFNN